MNIKQILLALSGSEVSEYAAKTSFALANRTGAKVKALHVINTAGAWAYLGMDRPGLIGSGMFVKAYDDLKNSLTEIGTKLAEKFEAVAAGNGISAEAVVSEGNPIVQICKESQAADLVIVGHRQRAGGSPHHHFDIASIAEGLAHECNRPLLVVRNEPTAWNKVRILLSMDHVNYPYIAENIALASSLGAQPVITCLGTGTREEAPTDFMDNLKQEYPALKSAAMEFHYIPGLSFEKSGDLWKKHSSKIALDTSPTTLIVVPTRMLGDERITIFGNSPEVFIREVSLPKLLLCPEDGVTTRDHAAKQAAALIV